MVKLLFKKHFLVLFGDVPTYSGGIRFVWGGNSFYKANYTIRKGKKKKNKTQNNQHKTNSGAFRHAIPSLCAGKCSAAAGQCTHCRHCCSHQSPPRAGGQDVVSMAPGRTLPYCSPMNKTPFSTCQPPAAWVS